MPPNPQPPPPGRKVLPSWALFIVCAAKGSPSSKYEHWQTSALLRNIRNIRIYMGKNPIVSVPCENERISIKNSLSYTKSVIRLSWVVHGPIFMGYTVNGVLFI